MTPPICPICATPTQFIDNWMDRTVPRALCQHNEHDLTIIYSRTSEDTYVAEIRLILYPDPKVEFNWLPKYKKFGIFQLDGFKYTQFNYLEPNLSQPKFLNKLKTIITFI